MKHHPDLSDPEADAIFHHMERARMTPCTCNTDMGDTCPACAPRKPEAPAEVDRSGWPVLVLDGVDYYRWPTLAGRGAVWVDTDTGLWTAYHDSLRPKMAGDHFPTALAAADAVKARLPDEASEAEPFMGPAELAPPLPGDGYYAVDNVPGYDRTVHVKIVGGTVWGHSTFDGIGGYRTIGCRIDHWYKPCMRFMPEEARGIGPIEVAQTVAPQPPRPDPRDAELATLRAQLDARTKDRESLDAAWMKEWAERRAAESTLSTLRDQLAFLVPDGEVTDAAIVAAAKALMDHGDGQDDTLLTAGLGLLDQAALGNPTLGYVATVIRRGVGRG